MPYPLNSQMMILVAFGILPGDTANQAAAPQTFGCRAVGNGSPVTNWNVTLEKPLVNGTYLFFWGPTVVNLGTSSGLTSVTVSTGGSTDTLKNLVLNGASGVDVCFAFYQIPTV